MNIDIHKCDLSDCSNMEDIRYPIRICNDCLLNFVRRFVYIDTGKIIDSVLITSTLNCEIRSEINSTLRSRILYWEKYLLVNWKELCSSYEKLLEKRSRDFED